LGKISQENERGDGRSIRVPQGIQGLFGHARGKERTRNPYFNWNEKEKEKGGALRILRFKKTSTTNNFMREKGKRKKITFGSGGKKREKGTNGG